MYNKFKETKLDKVTFARISKREIGLNQSVIVEKLRRRLIALQLMVMLKLEEWKKSRIFQALNDERGDVPGWVLVVLMTTGLVTAIWTIAAPRLSAILRNSLDAMNGIR
ncbi:MAG: hypothetical protein RL560_568 [Actinomycetota bacterium]|jgi:hypothetical protein